MGSPTGHGASDLFGQLAAQSPRTGGLKNGLPVTARPRPEGDTPPLADFETVPCIGILDSFDDSSVARFGHPSTGVCHLGHAAAEVFRLFSHLHRRTKKSSFPCGARGHLFCLPHRLHGSQPVGGGFGASISINNTGTTAISNWTLTWAFADGQIITQLWNGIEAQSGANVSVSNESYNGSIASGGVYSGMGFNGSWNNTSNASPSSFAVNGVACQ